MRARLAVFWAYFTSCSAYSTWCGKYYELAAPHTPPAPDSYFVFPKSSSTPLLDFRCTPASSIYISGDLHDLPEIIMDASLTYDVGLPVKGIRGELLQVQIFVDGVPITSAMVPLGSIGHMVSIPLEGVSPRVQARSLRCTVKLGSHEYTSHAELRYMPEKKAGSIVKLDRRTGGTWARRKGEWKSFIPFGWYDSIDTAETPSSQLFDWWSPSRPPTNAQRLDRAHSLGSNMIHPVPPGKTYQPDGPAAINAYFDRAEELGLWIMYDMRHALLDLASIEEQVLAFRDRPNLLTWYIADEPDGPPTPLDAVIKARDLIHRLDPYHPISLVLNCNDHYWTAFTAGTDILLADVYSIAINPIYSKKWSTPVTPTFGASGCDGCQGNFYDLADRLDSWEEKKRVTGRKRDLVTWVVPQAFDDQGEEFWWRVPEGREEAVQVILAWNHGVMGHCAWLASSSTPDLLNNASFIASHLYSQSSFLIDRAYSRRPIRTTQPLDGENGIDVASWTKPLSGGITETLVMAAQLNYIGPDARVDFGILGVKGKIKEVLFGGVYQDGGVRFRMGRISVAAVILRHVPEEDSLLAIGPPQLRMGIGQPMCIL
ncbi:uncharacterized protein MKK02DRAFT_36418 [Dioszegia hungarica]|uniref:Uncharacterized protein n=1 Tax=Dioszegia hungarica TaxID=4972 RepID=A0AA38LWA5_9TREE|nr:uncharacterized protein MKK02DRAFT_36418 [Dioszegia hungarica]KAI9637438.1 hypothetical protein MKK02DRAFT_36418 [Dioszegia hungarica]